MEEAMHSVEINELSASLSKAQSQLEGAKKDASNPFFKSNYADLQSVWDACRKALTSNNLCVIQTTEPSPDGVTVITTLAHSSGQWIRGRLTMKATKNDAQGIGSCISYARRYALAAIVGVYQTDDDANHAVGHSDKPEAKQKKPAPFPMKGVIKSVKVRARTNEVGDDENEVWVDIKTADGQYVCMTGSEPNMSKLLDSEGTSLELLVMHTGKLTKDERQIHSIHQVFPLPIEGQLTETKKLVKA